MKEVIVGAPSASTINRQVIEKGAELLTHIHQREISATTLLPDGTKLHSKTGGKHDARISMGLTDDGDTRLRSLTVGKSWNEHRAPFSKICFQTSDGRQIPPTSISDMEPGLVSTLKDIGGYWQPCLFHIPRYLGHRLWEDGVKAGKEKDKVLTTCKRIIQHLKNSVNHHLPKGEKGAIRHRIKQTVKEFRRLSTRLSKKGRFKASGFLRKISNHVTTFASLAIMGISIPLYTNKIERLMGEVSKRCKHKWMSWTDRGSQALLALIVCRVIEPRTYHRYWHRNLFGTSARYPDLGVTITWERG